MSQLQTISLRSLDVPVATLRRIPLSMVRRYQIIAFEDDGATLKLAIVNPDQLKPGFYTALEEMGRRVKRAVAVFRTDPGSFALQLKRYEASLKNGRGEAPAVPPTAPPAKDPPLFKLGEVVAFNYLKRVPFSFAKQNRVLSVDFLPPRSYWFITDTEHEPQVRELLPRIAKENDLDAQLLVCSVHELDDLLGYYEHQLHTEAEKKAAEKRQAQNDLSESAQKPELMMPEEQKLAPGVTSPDLNAKILSQEDARGGIAGVLQQIELNIEARKAEEAAVAEEKKQKLVPEKAPSAAPSAAPDTGMSSRSAALPVETVAPAAAAQPAPVTRSDDDSDIGKLLEAPVTSVDQLKEQIRKGYIPRIVASVVSYAIDQKASDIHIESFEDEVRVRYRIDGQLIDVVKLPPDVHAAVVSRIKILSRLRLDETRIPQDGRFDVDFRTVQVDVRVSVMPTVHGEKVVLRILDKSRGVASLEELGLQGTAYNVVMEAIQRPFGVILATGPTGSGKSTTLYAILQRIATPNVNVVTLEDPVEYEMKGINQAQVRPKIGFTFAEGLRSVLRQDPNVIMVGEIRDGETANMATQAALTGHLVLSTLHTNDAAGAIPRLINMGIEPFLISSSLAAAVGQRLVRKVCPHCAAPVSLPQGVLGQLMADIQEIQRTSPEDAKRIPAQLKLVQGTGCPKCNGKGYLGRTGIYEVLSMNDELEELTLKRSPDRDIAALASKQGMLTMYQDGIIKVVNGITTLDEVLRETTSKL